jgi:hypothetical protein
MTSQQLDDFLILRELDDSITRDQLADAAETSGEVLTSLREEGVEIRWVESEVMTNADGQVTGTFCHYQAEGAEAIREHGERAGLPVTRIDRRGESLDGE